MEAKLGDRVKVEYIGKLETGEIFDSSENGDLSHPIEFTVGNHEVIPGFEENVIGMKIEDEKEFSIAPENAYGPHREELVREIPKSQLPMENPPEVGMMLGLMTPDGRQISAKIVKITEDAITLDLNHPLAGKKLIFAIKVVDIKDGSIPPEAEKRPENYIPEEEEELVEKMEEVIEDSEDEPKEKALEDVLENNPEESTSEKELEEKLEEVLEESEMEE